MNLTLKQLQAIAALAKTTHFRSAAIDLGVSQPSLSRLIKSAEKTLGASLFDRHTRDVEITPIGEEVANFANDFQQLSTRHFTRIEAVARGETGTLALATLPSLAATIVASTIETFVNTRPDIYIDLIDLPNHQIKSAVSKGHYDLGIGNIPPAPDADIRAEKLFSDELFLVIPVNHRLAEKKTSSLNDVVQERVICSRKGSGLRDLTEAFFAQHQTVFRPGLELNQMGSMLGLIRAGIGIGFLPLSALSGNEKDAQLKFIRMDVPMVREICLFQRAGIKATPLVEAFTDELRKQLKKQG
ncbi:LysR family transcriptional regulator [uncultured Sulfitobacter sp.]|uniref:LysR family transcriptional regulator n=1 Tax=uncultured Sulfitobacter sp. TaxID=191468 RepID=UPI0025984EDC|nr:LysR family transcriptional regulator [uncultured Sulfitobacter sp.]